MITSDINDLDVGALIARTLVSAPYFREFHQQQKQISKAASGGMTPKAP